MPWLRIKFIQRYVAAHFHFDASRCFPTSEKLYEIEHPRYVKQFDDISLVPEDELGYWISKRWCRGWFSITAVCQIVDCPFKDWRLLKPKMHVAYKEDPAPDSSEFYNHVHCEHGGLSLNTTLRRRISREVKIQSLLESFILSVPRQCPFCKNSFLVGRLSILIPRPVPSAMRKFISPKRTRGKFADGLRKKR